MISFSKKNLLIGFFLFMAALFLLLAFVPKSLTQSPAVFYSLQKGTGYKNIAEDLKRQKIINSPLFFKFYVLISGSYSKLQAGNYELSQSMSVAQIVKKFVKGDIVKNKITVIEGWSVKDIAKYLEEKNLYSAKDFLDLTIKDWNQDQSTCKTSARPSTQNFECSGFPFLKDRPKNSSLEGYIFPDTYYVAENSSPKELLNSTLSNFDKKLSSDLREEIARQNKSIFKIITMASMLEKEVKTLEDKKIVSDILWKRIKEGIPLQIDATVNYVTGKSDAKVSIKDSQIDSMYNTYKYYGLPLGPISNPGMDSILAAIYPEESSYWYYLSADGNGQTIFSKTLDEHNEARLKYFK